MKICESCREENSEEAKVCKECGEHLTDKNSKIIRKSSFPLKRTILILSLVTIIAIGGYFIYNPATPTDEPFDVENPQIILDKIVINEIEKDWLKYNDTWQVSTTIYFIISNPNEFDVNISEIFFHIDLLDIDVYSRIFDGLSEDHIVKSNQELRINESFWFLAEDDGVDTLRSEILNYKFHGTVFFSATKSSVTQFESFDFEEEI